MPSFKIPPKAGILLMWPMSRIKLSNYNGMMQRQYQHIKDKKQLRLVSIHIHPRWREGMHMGFIADISLVPITLQ